MSAVQDVLELLERAGFARLPKPLMVVGTEFDFEAAARGTTNSHDLVVVATDRLEPRRLQRLVAGLARSLDLAASRRPVSLVLVGDVAASDRADLERYARVLPIGSRAPNRQEIEEAISVLLPLDLPEVELMHGTDPINEVAAAIGPSKLSREHLKLIRASGGGPEAVRAALKDFADEGAGWNDNASEDDE